MLVVREFKYSDLDQMMYHVADLFDQVNPPEFYTMIYEHWPEGFIVLEDEGKVRGFIIANLLSADNVRILIMGIVRGAQGKGFGKVLLTEFSKRARSMNIKKIMLEVRVSNTKAQEFYASLGFLATGILKEFYQDSENAYTMEMKI